MPMRHYARLLALAIVFSSVLSAAGYLPSTQPGSRQAASIPQALPSVASGTYFDHIVVIMMENEGIFDICRTNPPPCSNTNAPYMSSLANSNGIGSQYLSLIGTSWPDYYGILGASIYGCPTSCYPPPGSVTATNLVDRFESAGLAWKGYMENQNVATGCDTSTHTPYEPIHNGFILFQDITTNSARCGNIVLANPSGCAATDCALINDLASNSAPNFMWLTPNGCNDMYALSSCSNGCTSPGSANCINAGDKYLNSLVPNILNSYTFQNTRAALFITFDEGNGYCPLNGGSEDCLYAVWAGPVVKTSYGSSNLYNHYSLTKTIETNWNLPTLTSNDANANAMSEFFKPVSSAPDFTINTSPSAVSFASGSSGSFTATVSPTNGFTGTVNVSTSTSPSTGLGVSCNPSTISGGSGTSKCTLNSSTPESYNVTVTGTSGSLTHSAQVSATVTSNATPDFTISANPTSLTIGQGSSGTMTPVKVTSSGDQTWFESSYLSSSFYAQGLIWLFYEDSSTNCEGFGGCLLYTSSSTGSSWATPVNLGVHVTDSDFSVYTDGTNVYYARYDESTFESTCGRNIQFRTGTLSASGSVSWQPEQTALAGATTNTYPNDEIVVDSNGQAWIAFLSDSHGGCGGNGTDLPQIVHSSGTNYGSWSSPFTLSTAGSNNWHIDLASLGTGEIYAAYWLSSYGPHGRLFNGSTWGADEQISSTTSTDVNNWLFNSGTSLYLIYFDNSQETFNFAARSSSGGWTTNMIGAGESHTGSKFNSQYYSLPDAAAYDSTHGQFYLFWMNATLQRIDEWTGSGASWTHTIGVISTGAAPYPDSIESFFTSSTGAIFYITGSSAPFSYNFVALTSPNGGSSGTFTVTTTGQNGFTGTVNLSTSVTPSSGLNVGCNPASISGGSGSSTCTVTGTSSGSYVVTVTGTSGSLSHSTSVNVTVQSSSPSPDYSISANPSSLPITDGSGSSSTITITSMNGFSGSVNLSASSSPSGLAVSLNPSSVAVSSGGTASSTLTISAQSSTPPGTYTVTVNSSSGTLAHSTSISVTVSSTTADFALSANPTSLAVNAGSGSTSTITATSLNAFTGTVNLTASSSPAGPSLSLNPSSLPISSGGSATSTLTISTQASTLPGTYNLTLTGLSGTLSHSIIVSVIVKSTTPGDFSISANPTSVSFARGSSVTSVITLTSLNGFNGTINLSISTSQPGLKTSLSSPSITLTAGGTATNILTLGTRHKTSPGTYTVTITATSGSITHSVTITVTVS